MGGFPPADVTSNGERELRSLVLACADRLSGPVLRDGDWAVRLGTRWFARAHGRILPEEERASSYAPYRFYRYPVGALPPLPQLDAQSVARLEELVQRLASHPPRRSEAFLEELLEARSRGSFTGTAR
jgi:hypothetical protein